MVLEATGWP